MALYFYGARPRALGDMHEIFDFYFSFICNWHVAEQASPNQALRYSMQ